MKFDIKEMLQTEDPGELALDRDSGKNYIGLTGLTTVYQVEYTLEVFKKLKLGLNSNPMGMIGFLISPRNLKSDWYSSRYPRLDLFHPMLEKARDKAFTTLHIDEKSTSNWLFSFTQLVDKVTKVDRYKVHELVKGFQINVKHPNPLDICTLRETYPGVKIILQYASDFLNLDLDMAIDDLGSYRNCIDYILIDPSRGWGLNLDIEKAINNYNGITREFPGLKIGFAGGFKPSTIKDIIDNLCNGLESLDFSIDIETGLRTESDQLDLLKVYQYLHYTKDSFTSY